jgi:hypothetical protein
MEMYTGFIWLRIGNIVVQCLVMCGQLNDYT